MLSSLWSVYLLSPIILASFDRFLGLDATHSPLPGVGVASCISPVSSGSGLWRRARTHLVRPAAPTCCHRKVTVAEEGHVTRAAERLGIQQPPLSQQIRALEEELDVQLFRRKPRGMELTDVGRAFFNDARSILADVEQAKATARRTARGFKGKISLGFTLSASLNPFVPQVIRAFQLDYPSVSLNLDEGDTGELINSLRAETQQRNSELMQAIKLVQPR